MDDGGILLEAEKEYQKQYRFSRWWIEHRTGLRRFGVLAFACVDAIILMVAGWTLLDGFVVSEPTETRSVLELAAYGQDDLHAYAMAHRAKDLNVGTVTSVPSSEGSFDVYATVTNVNTDWWGEFSYVFTTSAGTTAKVKTFILPNSKKSIVAYAVASSTIPHAASVVISELTWHRVDHHVTGDVATWLSDRMNFVIINPLFEVVDVNGTSVPRIVFTVNNSSAFSYYEPTFIIRLLRGSTLVGVTSTTLTAMNTGETEDVSLNWFGTVPNANRVEVEAVVNPFDIDVYKPLEGETTEDTRTRVLSRGR